MWYVKKLKRGKTDEIQTCVLKLSWRINQLKICYNIEMKICSILSFERLSQ